MKRVCLALLSIVVLTGCARTHPRPKPPTLIVNPATSTAGRIVRVNPATRYVIVSYAFGNVPAADRRLNVYRQGLKVAEIKINEFRRDTNIVADIVAGECQVGDEVRSD
ncbi:MAG: hypothetical protein QOF48_1065 [Verrucomicrobiota bacterium]|jgi:hypothetical protein